MLTEMPNENQSIKCIKPTEYLTVDKVYLVEESEGDGFAVIIDDMHDNYAILPSDFESFELVSESVVNVNTDENENGNKPKSSISITGFEIDARQYTEHQADLNLMMKVVAKPYDLLKVLDSLKCDIEKLLRDKYRG